jgi:DNA-binding XRE family transcriptional regulator
MSIKAKKATTPVNNTEIKVNSLKDRLQKVFTYYGYRSKREFSLAVDLNPMTISHVFQGRNVLKDSSIAKILSKHPEINAEWLKHGRGDMLMPSGVDSDIVKRIIHLRNKHNHDTSIFAKTVGVTKDTVELIESGKTDMPISIFKRIVEIYKVDPNWILFGKTEETKVNAREVAAEIIKMMPEKQGFDLTAIMNSKLDILMQEIAQLKVESSAK